MRETIIKKGLLIMAATAMLAGSLTGCMDDRSRNDGQQALLNTKDGKDRKTEYGTEDVHATEDKLAADALIESKIQPTEEVKLVEYSNEYFSMMIPEGWSVETSPDSLIYYYIAVTRTDNPSYSMGMCLYADNVLKSQEAMDFNKRYYPELASHRFVASPMNSEGYFRGFLEWGGCSDFNVVNSLGDNGYGGDVINATFVTDTNEALEGIMTVSLTDIGPLYEPKDITDPFSPDVVDIMNYVASGIVIYYAPQDDFVNWVDTMNTCMNSIVFTDAFQSARQQEWNSVIQTSYQISAMYNEMSDMVMSSWEARNASFDIQMQKQSDATLDYERVIDTETGKVYRAEYGWDEGYTGNRFERTDADSAYIEPVDGYILK